MAKRNDGACPGILNDQIFAVTQNSLGDVLKFRSYYDECVTYSLEADPAGIARFRVDRNTPGNPAYGYISPGRISLQRLIFNVKSSGQSLVTMSVSAWANDSSRFRSEMLVQTSISSRYYK